MSLSRREFILTTAASAAALPLTLRAQGAAGIAGRWFRHGVASGDPLTDGVILWTRVTPVAGASTPVSVRWRIASDERLSQAIARGVATTSAARDYTVKVDARGLEPGRTYYYAFDTGGEQSPTGRTRTLPARADRLRLASISCSNYPTGYFNVYRCLANRPDLDAIVHLGDYVYETAAAFPDDRESGRVAMVAGEAVALADYRRLYAIYRSDVDLQEAHRLYPWVLIWDDHEIIDNASRVGAPGHTAKQGSWQTRRLGAYRAYMEWMPIRESAPLTSVRLYRRFRFGDLADLVMLDTRGLRDRQPDTADFDTLTDPRRSLLGAEQEAWLFDRLRRSQRAGTPWRLLGQQIIFAPLTTPGVKTQNLDVWDGYPVARRRVLDMIGAEKITDLAILTGDAHSSWAMDVPKPETRYDARTGAGSAAVELVSPAVSSSPMNAVAVLRERGSLLKLAVPHLKFLEGDSRGYILVDVTRERLQADWYFVPSVMERSPSESKATGFVCERGSSRLVRA